VDGSVVLRAGASLLAAGAFVGANGYVLHHPKNPDAPLQPPTVSDAPKATATPRPTAPPRITLQPGVRATELPRIAYTHVS
jgi:hypothetical protein